VHCFARNGKPLIYMVFIARAAWCAFANLREVCVGGIMAYVIHSGHPEPVWHTQGEARAGVPAMAAKP
jgi:hypothetical protein